MAYFSNGAEGMDYQERYCLRCKYHVGDIDKIGSDLGCPVWFLHELHNGEKEWRKTLDALIPMEPKVFNGITHTFAGRCSTFWPKDPVDKSSTSR